MVVTEKIGRIRMIPISNAANRNEYVASWKNTYEINYTKYQIKETDMRVKTASFSSPDYIDLTTGTYAILISSIYHENFSGFVLDVDYDPDTGLYNYQCQDWSRTYIGKEELLTSGQTTVYDLLIGRMTRLQINRVKDKNKKKFTYTQEQKKHFKNILSGLRSLSEYDQSLYEGNKYKGNPFKKKPKLIVRDKTHIEIIRDIVYNSLGYFDVWFNQKGILQIEPLSKKDWEKTGLHLTTEAAMKQKYKFSTTNAITIVRVDGSGTSSGKNYEIGNIRGTNASNSLNLAAFFGWVGTSISDPTKKTTTTSAASTTSNSTKTNSTTTTNVGKNGNPYNNKAKNIIISEDYGGTPGFKSGLIRKLKADGWNVTDLGSGPGTHSRSYEILSSKYAVNMTLYAGVDPKTVDECVTGWLKGKHEKYGVQLIHMWDSHGWTSKTGTYNKKGMWYYRNGDFTGYKVPKAWDDNYSGAHSGVLINDLDAWYKKYYPKVIHCAGTTVDTAWQQFKAGGYFRMKGIK